MCGLCRTAICGRHWPQRPTRVHRAVCDLGHHVIGAPRPAADVAGEAPRETRHPFLSALAMLGYGLAGAVSPYLGVVLRNEDPRLPFVISGPSLARSWPAASTS